MIAFSDRFKQPSLAWKKKKKFYFVKQIHVTTNTQHVITAGCRKKAITHQSWPPIAEHRRTWRTAFVISLAGVSLNTLNLDSGEKIYLVCSHMNLLSNVIHLLLAHLPPSHSLQCVTFDMPWPRLWSMQKQNASRYRNNRF